MKAIKKRRHILIQDPVSGITPPPYHDVIPFERKIFAGGQHMPICPVHIAVHYVRIPEEMIPKRYAHPHQHDADEINILISFDDQDSLIFEFEDEDGTFTVTGNKTIFIPRHTLHAANAISGQGLFFCIVLSPLINI